MADFKYTPAPLPKLSKPKEKEAPKAPEPKAEDPDALEGPQLDIAEGAYGFDEEIARRKAEAAPQAAPAPPVPKVVDKDLNIVFEQPPAIKEEAAEDAGPLTQRFRDLIAFEEGGRNKEGKWVRYEAPEGKDTIGIGHLIQPGEEFDGELTDEQVQEMFTKDLQKAEADIRKQIGEEAYDGLDNRRKQMLIDFTFNMGAGFTSEFPKFMAAVLANDMETALAESKRGHYFYDKDGNRIKGPDGKYLFRRLTKRNARFVDFHSKK